MALIHLTIVTPKGRPFEGEARRIVVRTRAGDVCIMPRHIAFAAALGEGEARVTAEDGTVRRFVKGNSRHFTYQILGGEECHAHLHLKCVDCGRVVHLDHEATAFVQEHLLQKNHFVADEAATMLFGRCNTCAVKG